MAPSPDPTATLRAAVEVFVPGPPYDPTDGAGALGAHRFVADYLDYLVPGLSDGLPALLDQIAAERFDGAPFASLRLSEREVVLESLEHHEVAQLRDLPELLAVLTIGATYGEWSGTDESGALVHRPWGWEQTGFPGPARERPGVMHD